MKKNQLIALRILAESQCGLTIRKLFEKLTDDEKVEFKNSIKTLNGVLSIVTGLFYANTVFDSFGGKRVAVYEITDLGHEVLKKEDAKTHLKEYVAADKPNSANEADLPVKTYPLSAIDEYIVEEKALNPIEMRNQDFDEAISALKIAYYNKQTPKVIENKAAKIEAINKCLAVVNADICNVLKQIVCDIEEAA